MTKNMSSAGKLLHLYNPTPVKEGDNAQVSRIIGSGKYRHLDPFLIFDHFSAEQPSGFPDHPHRGFQLVTYCIRGSALHQDSTGVSHHLQRGDIQCLTAGRGVVHSLFPCSSSAFEGLELWVNLPIQHKMTAPHTVLAPSESLPTVLTTESCRVAVLVGRFHNLQSPIATVADSFVLDVEVAAGGSSEIQMLLDANCIVYLVAGDAQVDGESLGERRIAVFFSGNEPLVVSSENGGRLLVLCGRPINEPIVQHGPFVMSTQQEVIKCVVDFNRECNGFEGCASWQSEFT